MRRRLPTIRMTSNTRRFSQLTNDDLIVLLFNLSYPQCIDAIKRTNISGELLGFIETIEELDAILDLPLTKVDKSQFLLKIQDLKNIGVDTTLLNHKVFKYLYYL